MTDENMTDEQTASAADANSADKSAEETPAKKPNQVIKIGSQRPGHKIPVETKPAAPALDDSLEDDSRFVSKSPSGSSAPADELASGAIIADSGSTTATSDHIADNKGPTNNHAYAGRRKSQVEPSLFLQHNCQKYAMPAPIMPPTTSTIIDNAPKPNPRARFLGSPR